MIETSPLEMARELAARERPLLIASDVDGTLAPIVAHPSDAKIDPDALSALRRLVAMPEVHVALVTGRDLDSLQKMESLEGVWRGVEHGGLVVPPVGEPVRAALSNDKRAALKQMKEWVALHGAAGVVEVKPAGVAFHTRQLSAANPTEAARLRDQFAARANELGLPVRYGRELVEVEAERHDKSEALGDIFVQTGAATCFFAGDDLTDFGAIEFAAERGVGVVVHAKERSAQPKRSTCTWAGVSDVVSFLVALADVLER